MRMRQNPKLTSRLSSLGKVQKDSHIFSYFNAKYTVDISQNYEMESSWEVFLEYSRYVAKYTHTHTLKAQNYMIIEKQEPKLH